MTRARARERIRRDPALPRFEPGFKLRSSLARFDKVEIAIDLGFLEVEDRQRIFDAFKRIGQRSNLLRADGNARAPKLITRARNEQGERSNEWLFSAFIRPEWGNRLRAYLKINPQRFFVHTPPQKRRMTRRHEASRIMRYGPAEIKARMQSLDGEDNFVVGGRLQEAAAQDWPELTLGYIDLVRRLLQTEIRRHAPRLFLRPATSIEGWSIQHLEMGWEFHEEDAPATVKFFGLHASDYFLEHRCKMHLDEITRELAATYYIFRSSKSNVEIAMYAKAEDRIRIEARFKQNPKMMYPDLSNEEYPRTHAPSMADLLGRMRRKAAAEIKPLKEALDSYERQPEISYRKLTDTLAALAHIAKGNQTRIAQVLRHLKIMRRVSERTGDAAFNRILVLLTERGFLRSFRKMPGRPREYAAVGDLKTVLRVI